MIGRDGRQIPKSRHNGVEQCSKDSRLSLFEFAPESTLVAAHFRLYVEEIDDQCTIKKIGPRSAEVWNRIEHQRTCRVEDRLIMIAIKLPAPKAAAGRQTAGGIGQFVRQVAQIIETHEPRVS